MPKFNGFAKLADQLGPFLLLLTAALVGGAMAG